jgi:hypothetical protein
MRAEERDRHRVLESMMRVTRAFNRSKPLVCLGNGPHPRAEFAERATQRDTQRRTMGTPRLTSGLPPTSDVPGSRLERLSLTHRRH